MRVGITAVAIADNNVGVPGSPLSVQLERILSQHADHLAAERKVEDIICRDVVEDVVDSVIGELG